MRADKEEVIIITRLHTQNVSFTDSNMSKHRALLPLQPENKAKQCCCRAKRGMEQVNGNKHTREKYLKDLRA